MAKYIDADNVLQCIPDDLPYKASVKRVLIQSPAADVVEIKHGKWIICRDGYYPYCNQCGYEPIRPLGKDDNRTPYCPNCGAKMEKEI